MENRKILFFDIDGTLLSHRTLQIPESAKKSIRKAKEKGHLVFINTGRTISVVNKEIKELGLDGYICGCGSYIEVDGEVIYSNDIDKSKYTEIINKIEEYDLDVVLEGREAVYYNRDTSTDAILTDFIKNNYPVSTYKDENLQFDKMYMKYGDNENLKDFCDFTKDLFDFIDHGNGGGEMVPKGHSKATGIDFVLNHYNIDDKDSYAFGDSNNDIHMFERVTNSIVMGNGNPELFENATFVTKDIDEDGIEHAMKHFNII